MNKNYVYLVWERYDERDRVLRVYDTLYGAGEFVDDQSSDVDLSPEKIEEEQRGEYSHYGYHTGTGISMGYWVEKKKLRGPSEDQNDSVVASDDYD